MIVPLFGHHEVRERLENSLRRGSFPASLLLQGMRGVGKQRLALWLGTTV
jgi:DNA polymerase-3 subunit delta'